MNLYKEMYLTLFKAVTKSIDILQKAQQKCEELYINEGEEEKSEIIRFAKTKK